jgi:hypothetical protein
MQNIICISKYVSESHFFLYKIEIEWNENLCGKEATALYFETHRHIEKTHRHIEKAHRHIENTQKN